MHTISWFIENQYLGKGEASPEMKWGKPVHPNHIAFYCPLCGEVWARMLINRLDCKWYFIPRNCKKHGPPFLLRYDDPMNESAPINVWAREFLIAMEWRKAGRDYETYLVSHGI